MNNFDFSNSNIGAQSAWKGFISQTFYIAYRLIMDKSAYEYYPENIEDLIIKKDGIIKEAVQIKNMNKDLTLSDLAVSKTTKNGEGFFNIMCSLHNKYADFSNIVIVHFGALGKELQEVANNDKYTKIKLATRLTEKHNLLLEEATWIIDSLKFEKVSIDELKSSIENQIKTFVPVMVAPTLAKDLLIHYIFELSNAKGFTTLELWNEKVHCIGVSISAMDEFYKSS